LNLESEDDNASGGAGTLNGGLSSSGSGGSLNLESEDGNSIGGADTLGGSSSASTGGSLTLASGDAGDSNTSGGAVMIGESIESSPPSKWPTEEPTVSVSPSMTMCILYFDDKGTT
jgi:hypothetical protein